jgi:AcrR family transcriptional regulator
VVAEAARIADEMGYDQLTLAAVAGSFGVAVPSLYKHVAGVDALREHLAARAIAELGTEISTAVARGGAEPLRALAAAYRGYARAHPGRYAATLRAPGPANPAAVAGSQSLLDIVYEVLMRYGLAEEDLVDATRSLRSASPWSRPGDSECLAMSIARSTGSSTCSMAHYEIGPLLSLTRRRPQIDAAVNRVLIDLAELLGGELEAVERTKAVFDL